ncbi:MAG: DEAD/DEAH box helicase [Candidatus Saccharimonas sp.]|nr:DEAD/DEAH box helicase [Candidatus Saccharimonas sp.]
MQKTYHARPQRAPYRRPQPSRRKQKPSDIHPSKFINKAIAPSEEQSYIPTHQFRDFGLNSRIVDTLIHLGYETPSPIQDQAIPPALAGKDVIGLANTGTGKTAAFLLPIIEKLLANPQLVSVLILAPTRELAGQIDDEFRRFSAGHRLYSTLVVGGANINRQIQQIKRGPHVVIGTPGRIKDLIDRRVLRLSSATSFVLDEADRMCDMGFVRDIRIIEAELPRQRQTYCFSATMTPDVQTIVEQFMHDPITIQIAKNQTNDHIEQDVVHARDKFHKIEILTELLSQPEFEKVIVFGDTKYGVQRLSDNLVKSGIASVAIHGNKSQGQRDRALSDFKSGRAAVMVATDVAARGLDIPAVSHVINFDPPKIYSDYVHRIGRTGRAGKSGNALTFIMGHGTSQDRPAAPEHTSTVKKNQHEPRRQRPQLPRDHSPQQQTAKPFRRKAPSSKQAEDRLVRMIQGD